MEKRGDYIVRVRGYEPCRLVSIKTHNGKVLVQFKNGRRMWFPRVKVVGAGGKMMAQKIRKERITKVEWYKLGGFENSALFRQQSKGGAWRYYINLDRVS